MPSTCLPCPRWHWRPTDSEALALHVVATAAINRGGVRPTSRGPGERWRPFDRSPPETIRGGSDPGYRGVLRGPDWCGRRDECSPSLDPSAGVSAVPARAACLSDVASQSL